MPKASSRMHKVSEDQKVRHSPICEAPTFGVLFVSSEIYCEISVPYQ